MLSSNNPTRVKIAPGKQVMLQDWQSSRPTVICTCSLLCRADAGPLKIIQNVFIHVYPYVYAYGCAYDYAYVGPLEIINYAPLKIDWTSGNKRSQTGRGWLKSLWRASPILALNEKSDNWADEPILCSRSEHLSSSQFRLRNIVSDRAQAQPRIGAYLKHHTIASTGNHWKLN